MKGRLTIRLCIILSNALKWNYPLDLAPMRWTVNNRIFSRRFYTELKWAILCVRMPMNKCGVYPQWYFQYKSAQQETNQTKTPRECDYTFGYCEHNMHVFCQRDDLLAIFFVMQTNEPLLAICIDALLTDLSSFVKQKSHWIFAHKLLRVLWPNSNLPHE